MDYADSDEDIRIPSKLVITGKSTMSLHERFSNLPAPRKVTKPAPPPVKKYPPSRFVEPSFEELMEEDVYDPEDAVFDYPAPSSLRNAGHSHSRGPVRRGGRGNSFRPRGVTRQIVRQAPIVIQEVAVPIEERLTLPKIVYVQTSPRGVSRQYHGNRGGRGNINTYRGNFNKYQANRAPVTTKPIFKKNFAPHQRGALRGNVAPHQRGAFRGNRGRDAHQNFNNTFQGQTKKSAEEMDREIDEYMKGGKHPRISF